LAGRRGLLERLRWDDGLSSVWAVVSLAWRLELERLRAGPVVPSVVVVV
jgi:hypothetical protein